MANYAGTEQEQGAASGAASRVSDAASAAQETVGEKAGELRSQGRERLRQELDTRTTGVGQDAQSVAQVLRESTGRLRDEGKTGAATAAEQVAERVERLGDYLERSDGDAMLRDVERFARNRPWVFAGLGALVGMAAARFVKASSDSRSQSGSGGGQRELPPASYGDPAYARPGAPAGSASPQLGDSLERPRAADVGSATV